MTAEFETLRSRVEAYALDRADDPTTFTDRLAREQRWRPAYARRVAREYLRFALLAATSPHPLTPSKAVDEAWHLHLTDSRRYWEEFCPRVLGRPLHHEPGRGGPSDAIRHRQQYLDALAAYEQRFGEPAPADIWPRPGRGARPIVDRLRTAAPAALALALTGCAALYDSASAGAIQGPQFAIGFGVALVFALLLTRWLAGRAARSDRAAGVAWTSLAPYELAYLSGGGQRVLETAVLKLNLAGALIPDPATKRLVLAGALPAGATVLEQAIVAVVEQGEKPGLAALLRPVRQIRAGLSDRGLLADRGAWGRAWLAGLPLMGLLFALGLLRLSYGLHNRRAVAFLVIEMFLAAFFWLLATAGAVAAGAPAARIKAEAMRAIPRRSAVGSDDPRLLQIAALYGLGGLGAGMAELALLQVYIVPPSSDSGSSGSSGCGGGCGGGGCGG